MTILSAIKTGFERVAQEIAAVRQSVPNIDPNAINADTVDGLHGSQLARTDVNEVFSGHVNIARANSDEQLRIGQNRSGNPFMAFYRNSTREGFIQIVSDRLRLVSETGSTDRRLDLLDNGSLVWNNVTISSFQRDTRLGARTTIGLTASSGFADNFTSTGHVMVGLRHTGDQTVSTQRNILSFYQRPIQRNINGSWLNVGQL